MSRSTGYPAGAEPDSAFAAAVPVWVEAVEDSGALAGSVALRHGEHPEAALARAGWVTADVLGADLGAQGRGITLRYAVRDRATASRSTRLGLIPASGPAGAQRQSWHAPARDADLELAPGERPAQVQRVAAYALARSAHGVLLTQLSHRTHAPGRWTLPGGGLEPGELPEVGLRREVREESGQELVVRGLLGVLDGHWVGRAPSGRVEDYHVVRLLYLAQCPAPTDPFVQEVDGTTAAAAWVPTDELESWAISSTWREVLTQRLWERLGS